MLSLFSFSSESGLPPSASIMKSTLAYNVLILILDIILIIIINISLMVEQSASATAHLDSIAEAVIPEGTWKYI